MKKRRVIGLTVLSGLLLLWLGLELKAWAAEDELQIGIPDLPRRIGKELPEIAPGREIEIGILKFHPSFQTKIEYDDNIKLQPIDDIDDVIFTQSPGILAEARFGDHRFEAGYGMEIVNFTKDTEENAVNHLTHGLLELNFNDLQITTQDLLEKSTSRRFSETSERDELLVNTVDVLARYDRPRWAAEVDWRHNTLDHRKEVFDASDYEEDVLAFLGGYKALPKTLFLTEFDLGSVRYRSDGNANQDYYQIFGGVRGEPTEQLELTAKIGFQDRQLGDVPQQGGQSDFDGVVVASDIMYRPSQTDSFRMGYTRTVKTSTFADNSWYRQDRIFTSYRKQLFDKWTLTPLFSWQLNDYPEQATIRNITKRREDSFWQASLELRYNIQEWLSTGIIYKFRSRNSNIDPFDFENNRVAFDINFIY